MDEIMRERAIAHDRWLLFFNIPIILGLI